LIIKFLQAQVHALDMRQATKRAEVVHDQCLAVPHLIRSLPIDNSRWWPVENIHTVDTLLPRNT
jgi:hypothetical protein